MSKGLIGTVATFGAFALMAIPGVGTALGLGMMIGVGSITAAHVVGVGLMLASSILLAPKIPKALSQTLARLQISFELLAPRKWVFGETAMPSAMRYVVTR